MIKKFLPITLFLAVLVAVCITTVTAALTRPMVSPSSWIDNIKQARPYRQVAEADMTANGTIELYELTNGDLTIRENEKTLWRSPDEWWIDYFAIADATHDGKINLVLSLWKSGNYGPSRPFWETQNDSAVKNHLFVLEFSDNLFREIWGSSNLSVPNCEMLFRDVDQDNKQELIVIEGIYTDDFSCTGEYLAVWKWDEWGFYNEWRSSAGIYQNIQSTLAQIPSLVTNNNL